MRISIIAIGSRGDVQPLIALGRGLASNGASVSVATTRDFESAVRQAGLESRTVRGHGGEFFSGAAGIALRDRLTDARNFRRTFETYLQRFYRELLDDVAAACADAGAIVCWPWTRFATSLAEAFSVPVFIACQYPPLHLPTAAFANPYQPGGDRSTGQSRRRSWRLTLPALQMGQEALTEWRVSTLRLAPIGWREDLRRLRRLPHLLGFSPLVVPRPADWAPWIHETGFWFQGGETPAPPADLAAFIEAGTPPLCIGFSSQVSRHAAVITRTVIEALARTRQRAVIVTAFGGLTGVDVPRTVFPISSVSYEWLFDRVSAVVHHGGSGSSASALRAGLPSLVVPFGYDQPFWAGRLHALGVSPAPIEPGHLTTESLAEGLTRLVNDAEMRSRARALGAALRAEDGVSRAAELVLSTTGRRRQ